MLHTLLKNSFASNDCLKLKSLEAMSVAKECVIPYVGCVLPLGVVYNSIVVEYSTSFPTKSLVLFSVKCCQTLINLAESELILYPYTLQSIATSIWCHNTNKNQWPSSIWLPRNHTVSMWLRESVLYFRSQAIASFSMHI